MFSVIGSDRDGIAYQVTVGDDGAASGSPRVVGALAAAAGSRVLVSPTGPEMTVTAGDPGSAWAWLAASTRVVETAGDLPGIAPPRAAGAVN